MFLNLFTIAMATLIGGAAIALTINAVISKRAIQKAAKQRYKDSFKALIKAKSKNAVNLGIRDNKDNCIETDCRIFSDKGVADNLYVGQIIYI